LKKSKEARFNKMLEHLKDIVLKANLELVKQKLVIFTWGNVSAIDRKRGLVIIKPSGVPYDELQKDNMVIVDLNGKTIEGKLKPSSDTPTHLVLYKNFNGINAVVHTHSQWATSFAQAGKSIPVFGTTHADYFYGDIPCTRRMTDNEINGKYEEETGKLIVETFADRNPNDIPGVLVNNHGPFTWGRDALDAVHNSVYLEYIAMLAFNTILLNNSAQPIKPQLLDKHYLRKHGSNAYYGQ